MNINNISCFNEMNNIYKNYLRSNMSCLQFRNFGHVTFIADSASVLLYKAN